MTRPRQTLLLATAVIAGCLSEGLAGPDPASLALVGADRVSAPAGSRVGLAVRVLDGLGGGVVRAPVAWRIEVEPGGVVLADAETVADGVGVARVDLRLGPTVGETVVRAAAVDVPDLEVTFTVTATTAPLPTAVQPPTFRSGDTVVVLGTDLDAADGFTVADVSVTVVRVVADTAWLIAPPCVTPGVVGIRATVDGVTSPPVLGEYDGVMETILLAPGTFRSFGPAAVANCARLPAAGSGGAEYVLAVQSASGQAGDSALYQLRIGPEPVIGPAEPRTGPGRPTVPPGPSLADRFHDFLREEAGRLPRGPRVAPPSPAPGGVATVVRVGERRNFTVCADIECRTPDQFDAVRAEARYVGDHAVIYVDQTAPPGFTDADLDSLGALFDRELYDVATRAFGAESDVDGDGRVAILLSPVVNRLTPAEVCDESFIAGFFFALDVNPGSVNDPRSNQAEVFYAIVPDPEGIHTCRFTVGQVRRQVPTTFVHELQHMINFHQHVMRRGGNIEVLWLNEAMSHVSEELAAIRFRALGDDTQFSRFAIGNLINAYDYLRDPEAVFALPGSGTGTLRERGAGWLFLRWLIDQYGEDLPRRLSETGRVGAANVEHATGEGMAGLLGAWFLSLWVSDLPEADFPDALKPARLRYTSWQFRTTFASLHGQSIERFPVSFPLTPRTESVSLTATGVLRAGSGAIFRLQLAPNADPRTVAFTRPDGGRLLDGVPRLHVLRIR